MQLALKHPVYSIKKLSKILQATPKAFHFDLQHIRPLNCDKFYFRAKFECQTVVPVVLDCDNLHEDPVIISHKKPLFTTFGYNRWVQPFCFSGPQGFSMIHFGTYLRSNLLTYVCIYWSSFRENILNI